MKRFLLAAAVAAVLAAPARANDSTAELAAGGLVLKQTDAIAMASEDLYISLSEVRVKYRFRNVTAKDVTTRVAFPMPDIGGEGFFFHDTAIPNDRDPANILDFKTSVDGRAVRMEVEQKAFVGDVDRTAWLKARKIPLALHLDGIVDALDALPQKDKDEAVKLGLAIPDEYDAGKGVETHLAPAWILKTTFHWEQTFPAGKEIVVEHRYKPAVGSTVATMVGGPDFRKAEDWPEMQRRYCIDESFIAGVQKHRNADGWPAYFERRLGYILKTGGNWAGPIGDFRMVIDKGDPKHLVSFCGDGVKKIGPTQFEVHHRDWKPERDLWVLVLEPLPLN